MNSLYDSLRISIEIHSILETRFIVSSQNELFDLSLYMSLTTKQKTNEKEKQFSLNQKQKITQLEKAVFIITSNIRVFNCILSEYVEHECLSLSYLQKFHATIQNRIEMIYRNFQTLERFEVYREIIMNGQGLSQSFNGTSVK